jgi:hypothetical protein
MHLQNGLVGLTHQGVGGGGGGGVEVVKGGGASFSANIIIK